MIEDLIRQVNRLDLRMSEFVKPETPLVLISESTLTGSVASVTFSSIPQNFRHLLVKTQARTDAVAELDAIEYRLNNDSGANYDRLFLTVNSAGVSATALRASAQAARIGITEGASSRASNFSPGFTVIFGYAITTQEKWAIALSAAFGDVSADTDLAGRLFFNRWRSTAAITSLVLVPATGPNFVSGSIFQLYGLS